MPSDSLPTRGRGQPGAFLYERVEHRMLDHQRRKATCKLNGIDWHRHDAAAHSYGTVLGMMRPGERKPKPPL